MLHVEQPHPHHARQQGHRQLHEHERAEPHQRPHQHDAGRESHVGPQDAAPLARPLARHDRGEAVPHEEVQDRADAKQHDGVTVHAVLEPSPARQREVFVHRQGVDVAEAAVLEVAGGGVVQRVGLLPVVIRRERQHAEHRADDVGGARRAEERAVPAGSASSRCRGSGTSAPTPPRTARPRWRAATRSAAARDLCSAQGAPPTRYRSPLPQA